MRNASKGIEMEVSEEHYNNLTTSREKWKRVIAIAKNPLHRAQAQLHLDEANRQIKAAHKSRYERINRI